MKNAIVISLIVLLLTGLLIFSVLSSPKEEFHYSYEVRISPPSEENWTVLVPFPSDENDSDEIIENMQVLSGSCIYELNHTEKGLALKISGRGEVHIKSSGTHLEHKYVRLSMSLGNNEETKYWVWHDLHGKNISFVIDLHIEHKYPGPFDFGSSSSTTINDRAEGSSESRWGLIRGSSYGAVAD